MTRLLLFDVDGTLVDVDGAGREALGAAMVEVYGETGPIESFDFHGRTDPAIVRGLLRDGGRGDDWIDARMDDLWAAYLEALDRALAARASSVRPCPGVVELLDAVSADDRFVAGLVTGNVRGGARRKLGACGLDDRFRFGAFGSDSERREDLPPLAVRRAARAGHRDFRPAEVWVIGDTPEDIACGRACGFRTLAVATGRHDRGALEEHGAHHAVEAFDDTGAVLRVLLS